MGVEGRSSRTLEIGEVRDLGFQGRGNTMGEAGVLDGRPPRKVHSSGEAWAYRGVLERGVWQGRQRRAPGTRVWQGASLGAQEVKEIGDPERQPVRALFVCLLSPVPGTVSDT